MLFNVIQVIKVRAFDSDKEKVREKKSSWAKIDRSTNLKGFFFDETGFGVFSVEGIAGLKIIGEQY